MTETYPTDLTAIQKILVKANLNENIPILRKYDFFEVLDAIAYVVKTGIQWSMLTRSFTPYQSVYHHFRSWSRIFMEPSFRVLMVEFMEI